MNNSTDQEEKKENDDIKEDLLLSEDKEIEPNTSQNENEINENPPKPKLIASPPIRRGFPVPPKTSLFGLTTPINRNISDPEIIEKRSNGGPELRKLKISRPCFNPLDGMDPEQFGSKTEAYLVGYLNCLYHRLDGAKKIK